MNFRRKLTFEGHRMHELSAILALLKQKSTKVSSGNQVTQIKYDNVLQRLRRIFTKPKPDLVSPEEKLELLKLRRQTCIEEDKARAEEIWGLEFQNLFQKEEAITLKDEAIRKIILAIRAVIDDALRISVVVQSFNPKIKR